MRDRTRHRLGHELVQESRTGTSGWTTSGPSVDIVLLGSGDAVHVTEPTPTRCRLHRTTLRRDWSSVPRRERTVRRGYPRRTVLSGALGVPFFRNPLHAELNSPPEDGEISDRASVRMVMKVGSRSGGTPRTGSGPEGSSPKWSVSGCCGVSPTGARRPVNAESPPVRRRGARFFGPPSGRPYFGYFSAIGYSGSPVPAHDQGRPTTHTRQRRGQLLGLVREG